MLVKNRSICLNILSNLHRSLSTSPSRRPHYADWASVDCKRREFLDTTIRVDHAGEAGALAIYQGQVAVLRLLPSWWAPKVQHSDASIRNEDAPIVAVQHMLKQEEEHLQKFKQFIQEYQARPSLLGPLQNASGYAAGAVSALMGQKTAMALTIAIEEVIQEHYNDQIREIHERGLKDSDVELRTTLVKFRDEEAEHCQTGKDYHGLDAPFYKQFSTLVKGGCSLVIKVVEKI